MTIGTGGKEKRSCLSDNRRISKMCNKNTAVLFLFVCVCLLSSCKMENAEIHPADALNTGHPPDESTPFDEERQLIWEWVVPPGESSDLYFVDQNLLAVRREGTQYYLVTSEGEAVGDTGYDCIASYHEGIAAVYNEEKHFFIDENGKPIGEAYYQDVYSFSEGFAAVLINGEWGFIDRSGHIKIQPRFEAVGSFSDGLAAVKLNDQWGFISTFGSWAVENGFDEVRDFRDNCAAVAKRHRWGFVDRQGSMLTDCEYEAVGDFSEGRAAVMKNEKWGYIDERGAICIDIRYDLAGNFSEGKAAVKLKGCQGEPDQWAYITRDGDIGIDFYPYDASEGRMIWVGEFSDGLAFVSKTLYGIIDASGKNVFHADSKFFISIMSYNKEFDAIPGYVYVDDAMKTKKYGLVGKRGNQRLEPVFDYVNGIRGDLVFVENIIDGEYQKGVIRVSEG